MIVVLDVWLALNVHTLAPLEMVSTPEPTLGMATEVFPDWLAVNVTVAPLEMMASEPLLTVPPESRVMVVPLD